MSTTAVMLDFATLDRDDLSLGAFADLGADWVRYPATTPDQTADRIADAVWVVTNKVVLTRELMRQTPALKLICIAATGTNNVDLVAARELGIAVTHVAGYSTPSVVQHLFALLLALTTRLPEVQGAVASGAWGRSSQFCLLDFPFREVAGKRMGIVGYGALGAAVAGVAKAFGMEVLIAQRPGGPAQEGRVPLPILLPQVDVLSLHCPLTDQTRGLIGPAELALMKPDALLLNTARGGIVDEAALAEALRARRLGGAGIDVLAVEPPGADSPLLQPGIPNLIVTPHVAWASREARQRLIDEVAENIRAFQSGVHRNRVV